MANKSKMQLSLLDIEQLDLLLIAVAHHRRRSVVGHTLMALVQLVAHYSMCWKKISDISVGPITYNSCTLIVVKGV